MDSNNPESEVSSILCNQNDIIGSVCITLLFLKHFCPVIQYFIH